jgi:hypothetical protein
MLRYTANNKRKEMTLAKYSDRSLADARADAAVKMKQFRDGLDHLVAKKRAQQAEIKTVDDLFADWHIGNVKDSNITKSPNASTAKTLPHI